MIEPNNCLFLETTVQIIRFSGSREEKKQIDTVISKYSYLASSTYVKMEFKRRLIGDLAYFYNMLSISDSIADFFRRIGRLHSFQQRRINGFFPSFANFLENIENENIPKKEEEGILEKARRYFKYICQITWESFDKKLDCVVNDTDCINAKNGPILEDDKIYVKLSCLQKEKKCRIVEFFVNNRIHIENILKRFSRIERLDAEQEKMKSTTEKALLYPQNMTNHINCWRCGDLIIALECPQNAYLFTTNINHFSPICNELGKKILDNQDKSNSPPEESHA